MIMRWNDRHAVIEQGQALYEATIRRVVEPGHAGEFVVLDVESGAYELHADKRVALDRLVARHPQAVPFIVRVGHPTAVTLGAAGSAERR